MAKEAGLRARAARLDWGTLFRLGEAYPALVRLANGNWIIVSGAGEGPGGGEQVIVIDPLAEHESADALAGEISQLLYWTQVLMISRGLTLDDVYAKL